MLHRISIQIKAEDIGEAIANTDSGAQAEIINHMAMDLQKLCGYDFGMQLCSMAKGLNKSAKKMIKSLNDFVTWEEEV